MLAASLAPPSILRAESPVSLHPRLLVWAGWGQGSGGLQVQMSLTFRWGKECGRWRGGSGTECWISISETQAPLGAGWEVAWAPFFMRMINTSAIICYLELSQLLPVASCCC